MWRVSVSDLPKQEMETAQQRFVHAPRAILDSLYSLFLWVGFNSEEIATWKAPPENNNKSQWGIYEKDAEQK